MYVTVYVRFDLRWPGTDDPIRGRSHNEVLANLVDVLEVQGIKATPLNVYPASLETWVEAATKQQAEQRLVEALEAAARACYVKVMDVQAAAWPDARRVG